MPIAAVERDTGLLKDTLRVWEKRYGFPQPLRDANGERIYPREQIERLRQIRRLMDQGHRPGKLFAATHEEFAALLQGKLANSPMPEQIQPLLALIRASQAENLRATLQAELAQRGLDDFVLQLAIPLSTAVGQSWAQGELSVAQEHLYTEQLQNVLRASLSHLPLGTQGPRVLLSTFPDELHGLGILLAEALLTAHGAYCCSLGTQTPLEDLRNAAESGRFEVILLSFSAAFAPRAAFSGLKTLAASLPPNIVLWVGGRHLADKPQTIPGVRYLACMEDTLIALEEWRSAQSG